MKGKAVAGERAHNAAPDRNPATEKHIKENIEDFSTRTKAAIDKRIARLDAEWDIERMLELNFSLLSAGGAFLAAFADRRWLALSIVVNAFMLQHSLEGWCPPVSLLRKMGFRTREEIDREKFALKAMRGDFDVPPADSEEAWIAVNL